MLVVLPTEVLLPTCGIGAVFVAQPSVAAVLSHGALHGFLQS